MMCALSIRQPWAWLIVHAGKTIENRTWTTKFRGRFLIQAGRGMTGAEYADAAEFLLEHRLTITLPQPDELPRGGIVGEAELVDCIPFARRGGGYPAWQTADDRWFFGPHGFILRNAKPLPFLPCKGTLGFFTSPLFDQFP